MSDWKNENEWRDLNNETRQGFWYIIRWYAAGASVILVTISVLWATGVVFAGPKGAGDAYKTNQSGTNRIAKQEWFQQTYEDIQVADQNVDLMFDAMIADPSYANKTNYTATRAQCNQLVGNYDAEARKYTSQQWRDNTLPNTIDQDDPKFDCKEGKK